MLPPVTTAPSLTCFPSPPLLVQVLGGRESVHVRMVEVVDENGGASTFFACNQYLGGAGNLSEVQLTSRWSPPPSVKVSAQPDLSKVSQSSLPAGAQVVLVLGGAEASADGDGLVLDLPQEGELVVEGMGGLWTGLLGVSCIMF